MLPFSARFFVVLFLNKNSSKFEEMKFATWTSNICYFSNLIDLPFFLILRDSFQLCWQIRSMQITVHCWVGPITHGIFLELFLQSCIYILTNKNWPNMKASWVAMIGLAKWRIETEQTKTETGLAESDLIKIKILSAAKHHWDLGSRRAGFLLVYSLNDDDDNVEAAFEREGHCTSSRAKPDSSVVVSSIAGQNSSQCSSK